MRIARQCRRDDTAKDAMSIRAKLLVVDDDPSIASLLLSFLAKEGYQVDVARDGESARKRLVSRGYDLVILDRVLPDDDGFTIARDLRQQDHGIGIILLTGKGEAIDRVIGLELGADDFVSKPVHLRELAARVKSVLRRARRQDVPPKTVTRRLLFAGWTLDTGARRLTDAKGEVAALTTAEFDLLYTFLTHPNRVMSRDQLLDLARGRDITPFDRSIDVLVGKLRRKIELDPDKPALIQTVRGAGYILTTPVTEGK